MFSFFLSLLIEKKQKVTHTKYVLILLIFGLNLLGSFAQNTTIDSLKIILEEQTKDSNRLNILLELSKQMYPVIPSEGLFYAKQAEELSIELKKKDKEALALKYTGLANYYQGNYIQVILNWQQALEIFEDVGDKNGIANMLSNLGAVYSNQGNDGKAFELYTRALKIAEEVNDTTRLITTLNNIGLIHAAKPGSEKLSIDFYQRSLDLSILIEDYYGIGTASLNIGESLFRMKHFNKSLTYFQKSWEAYKAINSVHVSDALIGIAKIYRSFGDHKIALEYQKQSFIIAERMGVQMEMGKALKAMAETNIAIGDYKKALDFSKKALLIAEKLEANYLRFNVYNELATVNSKINNYKKAYEYLYKAMVLNDTIFSDENQKQINSIRVKYEIENMVKENEILKKDIELQEVKSNKQFVVIVFFMFGFLITSILIGMLIKGNKHKKLANIKLQDKNKLISSQQKEILDSIIYAKRIQISALSKIEELNNYVSESFVLFKPKDVVSGDFYWFSKVEDQLVVTVADCTGHGVPGAFMSMLGMSFLKLNVEKEYITQPDIILRRLRKEVVKALGQTGDSGEQKDGMDMSLCSINLETKELQWAGANNPILLVQDGKLVEIKPDKMPISIYLKMDKYTLHTKQLKKGDVIYMYSDGYPDQFGGPNDRKFMAKKLKQMLLEISDQPMSEQHNILELAIEVWMDDHGRKYNQTDDITVMGIRV